MGRQFYTLIGFLLFISVQVFGQRGVSRVYTDFNGFWTSAQGAINTVQPDNRHNLLAFTYNNITYSTGVNDALLRSRGVLFNAGIYQAFPVANIPLSGQQSNWVALGSQENDGFTGNRYPYAVPVKISDILTRGINGLDLGSGITNIPASAEPLQFNFGAIIDPLQINDGVPDLLISQIAEPGSNNLDRVWFEDINHNIVGNVIIIDMSNNNVVPSVGTWKLDLFSPVTGNLFDAATTRPIRIWAADVSIFGLNASNFTQPLYVRYKIGGASDPAFLAFNRRFIEIITADDDVAFTEINTPVNIDVLDNDGPTIVLSPPTLRVLQNPQHGVATVVVENGIYKIQYRPATGYEGTDSFTYRISNNASNPSSDDAVVNMTIGSADVSVVKAFSPAATYIGNEITFDIAVQNNGTGIARNVQLNDILPSGYTYISSSITGPGRQYNPLTGIWDIGDMNSGQRYELQVKARVNLTGNYTNTATVTATSRDNNPGNNSSTVTPVPIYMADLAVTKSVDNINPLVGSTVNFTIKADNLGPLPARVVEVADILPDGYTLLNAVPSLGTYTAATGIWQIGNLNIQGTAGYIAPQLTISAGVKPTGNYLNTAVISGGQVDAILSNNTATALTIPLPVADLSINKTMDNAALNNNIGSFTITVTNNGPSIAANVKVTDALPSGYSYVSSITQTGVYNAPSGEWNIGSLAVGAIATLRITTNLNPTGDYNNIASVTTDAQDPVPANNADSASPEPLAPAGDARQEFCEADLPTVAALRANGTDIKWYSAVSGGTALPNSVRLGTGITYYASQTIGAAESSNRLPVQVFLSPPPPAPTVPYTGPLNYCRNDPAVQLEATGLTGNILLWYTVPAGGTAAVVAPTPQTQAAGRTVYYVSQRNNLGCEGPRTAIEIIVNELPAAPLSNGNQVACERAGLVLTASATTENGYEIIWYNSNNQIVQQPTLNSVGTVTYYAQARNINTGCLSAEKTPVSLTINPAPPVPLSGGDQAECPLSPLQTLTARASTIAGTAIVWYDAPAGGNRVAQPALNQVGTVTYYAAASDLLTGCESLTRTAVTLTIYPTIIAETRIVQPTCANQTGSIFMSSTQPGLSYTLSATDQNFPPETNTSGQFSGLAPGIYKVLISNAGGCTLSITNLIINKPYCPAIILSKSADNVVSRAGDVISYTLTIRNTGNIVLNNLRVTDVGADLGSIIPASVNLSPGQSAIVKATHTLTLDEINQGFFSNQAAVSGVDPDNNVISDPLSDDPSTTAADDPTVVRILSAPAITLVKTGILSADNETITYNFIIRNTGNVTLSNIRLQDNKLGIDKVLETVLLPGQTITYTEQYQISIADKINRSAINTARAFGTAPDTAVVTDISGTQQTNDDPTIVPIPSEASIALVKTAVLDGNRITYTFTVTNTGKNSLQGITLSDPKLGFNRKELTGTLVPGASMTYEEVYLLTQADREAGRVINTATVNAETQIGIVVTDRSGSEISNDIPTTVTVPGAPVAINDHAETRANAAVLIDILANDDPVNSRFDIATIVITEAPKSGTVFINSDGTVTYTPLPGFTGEDSFRYRVSDMDGYQTNIALVTINANFFKLSIANTFTPNGDGINDYFNIVGLNQYAENDLTIFNRWGSEIYRKQNYENNWSGEGLGEGTYFYLLKVKRKGSQQFEVFKGWVLLKRAYQNQ
jgi:gliding motility-associated-like protein/uncharacterized repeat protein (TIGR01451 family)